MSHKTEIKNFLEMIMAGEIREAFYLYVAEDFVHHNQYTKPGREELIVGMEGNHGNFPDKIFVIEMMIEEGDKVMSYSLLRFSPEHTGLRVVHIFRFADNKIVEMRDVVMQLGE
jgi:predicted SnoaL-like aldol condensation-catalyzing enzyme